MEKNQLIDLVQRRTFQLNHEVDVGEIFLTEDKHLRVYLTRNLPPEELGAIGRKYCTLFENDEIVPEVFNANNRYRDASWLKLFELPTGFLLSN